MIDFDSVVVETQETPFSKTGFLKVSFEDERLHGFHVIVAADTDNGSEHTTNSRLTTLVTRFPRYILAEVNTHRVFGRNSASSRARSVKATIKGVMEEPFIPLWTINKRGMSGNFASAAVAKEATKEWLLGRDAAVEAELKLLVGSKAFNDYAAKHPDLALNDFYAGLLDAYYADGYQSDGAEVSNALSIHKQNANRIIEPFMWHESIITSSYWDNFLELRDHEDAQPEIRAMAVLMRKALELSTPKNSWIHAPFIPEDELPIEPTDFNSIRPVLMKSANECAQVSYNDKSRAVRSTASQTKGEELLQMKHYSPFEHQAVAANVFDETIAPASVGQELVSDPDSLVSNIDWSWVQLRPMLAGITK